MKLEYCPQNFENYTNINFMKILPLGAACGRTDGCTDRHEASSRFSQFSDAPIIASRHLALLCKPINKNNL